jgi:hypothetical protein
MSERSFADFLAALDEKADQVEEDERALLAEQPAPNDGQDTEAEETRPRPQFCRECGHPLRPTARFCGHCGNPIQ